MGALAKLFGMSTTAGDLRAELGEAGQAVTRASDAYDAEPTEARWTLLEDARKRVAQLEVRLRAAELREQEAARAEAEKARVARYAEYEQAKKRAHGTREALSPIAEEIAAHVVAIARLRDRCFAEVDAGRVAIREAAALARELGETFDADLDPHGGTVAYAAHVANARALREAGVKSPHTVHELAQVQQEF